MTQRVMMRFFKSLKADKTFFASSVVSFAFSLSLLSFASNYGATPEEMQAARISRFHLSEAQLEQAIDRKAGKTSERVSKVIAGISFADESPILLESFTRLTSHKEGVILSKPIPAHSFTSKCTRVVCATQEIFGKREGLYLLVIDLYYGFNASHLIHSYAAAWTADELELIFNVFQDFPQHLLPMVKGRPLILLRGYLPGSAIANATILVSKLWREEENELMRRYFIFHELGHVAAAIPLQRLDETPQWLALSGWKAKSKDAAVTDRPKDDDRPWTPGKPEACISVYSAYNPIEDFAESFAAYRYAPNRLKAASIGKFQFMKELIYDGVDYSDAKDPRNQVPRSAHLVHETVTKGFSEAGARAWINNSCGTSFVDDSAAAYAKGRSPFELGFASRQCVERALQGYLAFASAEHHGWSFKELVPNASFTRPNFQAATLAGSWSDSWISRYMRLSVEDLERAYSEFLMSLESPLRAQFTFSKKTPEKFCESNSKFAYMEASTVLAPVFDAEVLKESMTYRKNRLASRQDAFFNRLAHDFCTQARKAEFGENAMQTPAVIHPVSPERAKPLLNSIFKR